jgi:hypothetical protein
MTAVVPDNNGSGADRKRPPVWAVASTSGDAGACEGGTVPDTWIGFGILTHNLDRLVVIGATR